MTKQPMTARLAEATLFDNILSHEAYLPAVFIPGQSAGRLAHAESLLYSLALIEDHRHQEGQSEHEEATSFSQRHEAKLDLNLLMLGRLMEQVTTPLPVREVRWSIRGARLQQPKAIGRLVDGDEGILQIQPCDWLPERLELPVRILVEDSGWLWLRFPTFTPGLREVLERHLFRQHRRQIAQARTASSGG